MIPKLFTIVVMMLLVGGCMSFLSRPTPEPTRQTLREHLDELEALPQPTLTQEDLAEWEEWVIETEDSVLKGNVDRCEETESQYNCLKRRTIRVYHSCVGMGGCGANFEEVFNRYLYGK